ncbi:MAG TPA: Amuc_1100 family pilus-like protein, partial [Verrucomicrobiota bacterium]|nr:Amuc_1100 family pilus-like protein [Verrucomicrobiota bacterium]
AGDAAAAGVILPPGYSYSFEAQRKLVRFAPGSLGPLSIQLGEVRAICDILNNAKINSLDSIRRERVSTDDLNGPVTDYLDTPGQTNELAVLTPYEVSFRCFSPELSEVIAGFANSPHSIVVKTVNVEPAPSEIGVGAEATGGPIQYIPPPPGPVTGPGAVGVPRMRGEDDFYRVPAMVRPPPTYATPSTAATARPGGLQPFINEKQLRVTLLLEVVKLLPKQQQQE